MVKFKTYLNDRKQVVTECTLLDTGDAESVILYAKDNRDKAKAQKIALTKTLEHVKNKSTRQKYWDWFFQHSKRAAKIIHK